MGTLKNAFKRGLDVKKNAGAVLLFIVLCALLSTFGGVGSKAASLSSVYAATAFLSLAAAAGYWFLIRRKDPWFLLLFSSVFVVNTGYLAISLSKTVEAALWAGSVGRVSAAAPSACRAS